MGRLLPHRWRRAGCRGMLTLPQEATACTYFRWRKTLDWQGVCEAGLLSQGAACLNPPSSAASYCAGPAAAAVHPSGHARAPAAPACPAPWACPGAGALATRCSKMPSAGPTGRRRARQVRRGQVALRWSGLAQVLLGGALGLARCRAGPRAQGLEPCRLPPALWRRPQAGQPYLLEPTRAPCAAPVREGGVEVVVAQGGRGMVAPPWHIVKLVFCAAACSAGVGDRRP